MDKGPEEGRLTTLVPVGIAATVTAVMLVTAGRFEPDGGSIDPIGYALLTVGGMSLAFYKKWPRTALMTVLVAHFLYLWSRYPDGLEFIAILAALLLVTQAGAWRWAIAAAILSAVAVVGADIVGGAGLEGDTLPAVIGMTTVILLGLWLRTRSQLVAEARERAEQAERTREEEALRRVDEERLRIAREVHDTVAHSIATINVQAGTAVHVLDKRPEQALAALTAIKQASADAMRELRSTLGMLRDVDGASRSPSPRLAQLDDLVTMARDTGLQVDVEIRGDSRDLPSSIDLAAYRIVQESLTNVIRHADATRVTLHLDYAARHLDVKIEDDGHGSPGRIDRETGGTGIQGMRERAALLGGTLTAGSTERGFTVEARLPYED